MVGPLTGFVAENRAAPDATQAHTRKADPPLRRTAGGGSSFVDQARSGGVVRVDKRSLSCEARPGSVTTCRSGPPAYSAQICFGAQHVCASPGNPGVSVRNLTRPSLSLTLTGEIDLGNVEYYLAVTRAGIAECQTEACFTIDLSGVTFMGSTGLAMLVGIRKAATNAGMELRLDGIPARVSQLLQITGLADHFGVTAGPP